MNKSIRVTALFSIILTIILLINLTVVQAFSVDKYANNPKNQRGFYDMQTVARGQIFAGGTVLAQSTADEEGIYSRSYPVDSPAWGPVTGYLSTQYGASQLEASQNNILNGTDDSLLTSNFMDLITGEQPDGANVEVTIDPQLQQVAYDQLAQPGYNGAAVALQPSTGKILAMASSPSYNPNNIEGQWDQLQEEEGNPLLNHATQETLPPGSIFKIITTAAGLNNGYSPDSTLTGASEITLPGTNTQLTNYAGQVCGGSEQVSLTTAFSLSCNTAFVEMGMDVGADELRSYAEGFGIGQETDIGVETATGNIGEMPDDAAVGQSSIGQRDVSMSALQAAGMAATVANGGVRMEPYLANRITDSRMNSHGSIPQTAVFPAMQCAVCGHLPELMLALVWDARGDIGNSYVSRNVTAVNVTGFPSHVWYVAIVFHVVVGVGVLVKD